MDSAAAAVTPSPAPTEPGAASAGVWRLAWLTPRACRVILVLLLAFDFAAHLRYLTADCPIDLSGDEAQYWDWSRHLDVSYYSKGPLVAYIIRASCAVFGDTMPAVRLPALVFGTATLVVTYLLARKLFKSDRVALGAVLLFHVVPLFVAGSVLMTIDPPFFLCWAVATYLLAGAVFDGKRGAWPVIGVVVGIGFLAKYAMFLWFVSMLAALAADRQSRPLLRTRGPWLAVAIACVFTLPVVVWNSRHGWVSARHVGTQTGTAGGHFQVGNVIEFVIGQIGVVGPGMFALMVGAVVYALRVGRRRTGAGQDDANKAVLATADVTHARHVRFLAVIGVTFFLLTLLTSFRAKVQMNWPAPAYFTLMILVAGFLATRLADRRLWLPWRPWVWFTIVFGLVMMPIAHDPAVLYPAVNWLNPKLLSLRQDWAGKHGFRGSVADAIPEDGVTGQQVDFAYKLKGWEELGGALSKELDALGPGSFALCHDYQQASALAFYLKGQPNTYYAASYYQDLGDRGRMTQIDIWPDRNLEPVLPGGRPNPLVGKNAVFLGRHDKPFPDLLNAFDRVEGVMIDKPRQQPDGTWIVKPEVRRIILPIEKDGLTVRQFRYFRCYGFKGMARPKGPTAN
ncbi:MAG TPA: glycosyltransferase family 39 protein [Humisphaera sp.]